MGVLPEGACIVQVVRPTQGRPRITACEFREWGPDDSRAAVLAALRRAHGLDSAACTTVLDETEYSLLLTDAPDVPRNELKAAIRWRIKDLIDFHIDDATLDVFDVPAEAIPGKPRTLYAVAAQRPAIQRRVDLLRSAGIDLTVIDIPEMAQRNVAALLPEEERGLLFLSFSAASGLITITRQSEIFLARRLEIGLDALLRTADVGSQIERVVLEVQRSLDYFDSHFRQPAIAAVALAPTPADIPELVEQLNENLGIRPRVVDLAQWVDYTGQLPRLLQSRCFSTFGAALRQEGGG